jgi:hypothetical protein
MSHKPAVIFTNLDVWSTGYLHVAETVHTHGVHIVQTAGPEPSLQLSVLEVLEVDDVAETLVSKWRCLA